MATLVTVNFQLTPHVRRETHGGIEYLIAPVVAVRAGVLNGAWLPAEEIAKSVASWDGAPLPIGHPKENDQFISVNRADLLAACVGTFRNPTLTDDKLGLRGELWIDIAKARALGGDALVALTRLETGALLEVSTAYQAEIEPKEFILNGVTYHGIQRNLRPDHLALLPHEVGACSVKDGCGAPRVNADAQKTNPMKQKTLWANLKAALFRTVEDAVNEAEHEESLTVPPQAEPVVNSGAPAVAAPLPLSPNIETNCDCPPKSEQHVQEVQMDKKELVSNVLTALSLTEAERADVEAMPEAFLQKLAAVKPAVAEEVVAAPVAVPWVQGSTVTFGSTLSPDTLHLFTQLENQAAQQRTELTARIVANSTFTEPQCKEMTLDLLQQFAANLAPQVANYGGRAFPRMVANEDEGVPTAPNIFAAPTQSH